jgi:hypothetical protein
MMTREDMLRELELLPAWTLRTQQLQIVQMAPKVAAGQVLTVEIEQSAELSVSTEFLQQLTTEKVTTELVLQELNTQAVNIEESTAREFVHIASEDGEWLFVLPDYQLLEDESLLLRNILISMRIKNKPAETSKNTIDVLNLVQPQLVIAMGEVTAQYLLQSAESLTDLRGTVHTWEGIPFIVTYDLSHLLQTLPDKTKAWDDLCLAMQTLQRLKSNI